MTSTENSRRFCHRTGYALRCVNASAIALELDFFAGGASMPERKLPPNAANRLRDASGA